MALNLIKHIFSSENNSDVMEKLRKLTIECRYLTQEETKKRIKTYIDCGCDYRQAVKILDDGVTEKGLRASVNYANDALKRIIGENIVEQIESGDHTAELLIDIAKAPRKHPLLAEAWNLIPSHFCKGYDLNNCKKELMYFAVFSNSALKDCFESCDINKLIYIKHLIDAPSGFERRKSLALHKWLNNVGKVNKEKVAEFLEEVNGFDD